MCEEYREYIKEKAKISTVSQAKQEVYVSEMKKEPSSPLCLAERSGAVPLSGQCTLSAPGLELAKSSQEVKRYPKLKM